MEISNYIIGIPYGQPTLDFAEVLHGVSGLEVSQEGPRRRVQVSASEEAIAEARRLLPKDVLIEPIIPHGSAGSLRRAG